MAKLKFSAKIKLDAKEKALVEHYAYGIVAAAFAAHQISPHDSIKQIVTKALLGGLVAPILARVNPKSIVNQIDTVTGLPSTITEPVVDNAIADANKLVKQEISK